MAPSAAWNHFSKDSTKTKVKCKICKEELKYVGNTTVMILHLKLRHKIVINTLPAKGGRRRPAADHRTACDLSDDDPDDPDSDSHDEPNPAKRGKSDDGSNIEQINIDCPAGSPSRPKPTSTYSGPLAQCFTNLNAYKAGGTKDVDCTNALLYMMPTDTMPLCTPERRGFRTFCKVLQPLYKLPCEKTATLRLEEKYRVLRGKVGAMLTKAPDITLTSDIWTHKSTMRSYLGLTAHFRLGRKMVTVELGARQLDVRKTIANLQQALRQLCTDWNIEYCRVRGVVTDGGENIKGAVKAEFGEGKHVSCVAHKINNIGQKVIGLYEPAKTRSDPDHIEPLAELPENEADIEIEEYSEAVSEDAFPSSAGTLPRSREELKGVLKKVKRIVQFFRLSEVATSALLAAQNPESKEGLKLIQEVRTRWNSCFAMVERYLKLARHVTNVLLDLKRERSTRNAPPEILTGAEEEALMEVEELLGPLNDITLEVSEDKHVTLSKCIPLVRNLRAAIERCSPTTPIGKNLKAGLLEQTLKHFGQIEDIKTFSAATLLDPRYKKVAFTADERRPIRIANALEHVGSLVKANMRASREEEGARLSAALQGPGPGASSTNGETPAARGSRAGLWDNFDEEVRVHVQSFCGQDIAGGLPIQLRQYVDSPPSPRDNPDPMSVWDAMKSEYPHVYPVAREYLSLLASSVPCERLFSHAGLIATQLRNRLSGKHLEMLVFLRSCEESLWFS